MLAADRAEKLEQIAEERSRISRLLATDAANVKGGEENKQRKLEAMRRHLEYLKIQADINDPMIKKRFEDGKGMSIISSSYDFQLLTTITRGYVQAHLPVSGK